MTDPDLERRLREGLHREAERITPRERRTEILAMVHNEAQVVEPARRWFVPVGAAASVAFIGAIIWGVSNGSESSQITPPVAAASTTAQSPNSAAPVPNPSPPATSKSAAPAPIPSPPATSRSIAPEPVPSPPATPSPSVKSATGQVAGATTKATLPVYFVGASSSDRFGLYREFVRVAVPAGATPAQKARAAVAVAMNAQPFTNFEPYVQPWSGTSVKNVTVTPSLISITLSGPGAPGFNSEQTRLAVQELVWTAQAAIGKGPIPVKFVVAGSTKLFGTYPTARTYNRPAKDLQYQDLAPIWITSPVRGQVFGSGAPVVAKGESCAFEATTQWQLKKSGKALKSGVTTASSGCPTRGAWQVNLGKLAAGSYTFRMYELSMEDGKKVIAETSKPFTVR